MEVTTRGYVFMLLLACQFGLQPLFTKENVAPDADKVPLVLLCEALKTVLALVALFVEGNAMSVLSKWSLKDCVISGAVPAAIYAVQNVFIQIGYQHTTGLMFNLLNQTKIIFTAICVYLVVGKRQSKMQIVALIMVLVVGVTLSLPPSDSTQETSKEAGFDLWYGIVPTLVASLLSGIASAWSQRIMQGKARRSASLFSAELSFFSSMFLLMKMFSVTGNMNDVTERIQTLLDQNPNVWIHLCTNAIGGIFVGQVIKYAGGVRKSFSVIAGIILTGGAEWFMYNTPFSSRMILCLPMAILSMYIYATNPVVVSKNLKKKMNQLGKGGAGVILVTKHPVHGKCLILFCGKDKNKKKNGESVHESFKDGKKSKEFSNELYNHPGGKQDKEHKNQIYTAMHELAEETCGTVYAEYDVLEDQYLQGLYCGGGKNHLHIGLQVQNFSYETFKKNREVLKENNWKSCWLEMNHVRYVTLEEFQRVFRSNKGRKKIKDCNGKTIRLRNPIKENHIDLAIRTFDQNYLHSEKMVDKCKIFGKKSEKMPDGVRTLQISITKKEPKQEPKKEKKK